MEGKKETQCIANVVPEPLGYTSWHTLKNTEATKGESNQMMFKINQNTNFDIFNEIRDLLVLQKARNS